MLNFRFLVFPCLVLVTNVIAADVRLQFSARLPRNVRGNCQYNRGHVDEGTAQNIIRNMGRWSRNRYQARMSRTAANLLVIQLPTGQTAPSYAEGNRMVEEMRDIVAKKTKEAGCINCIVMK
ncbi:hypothetical protein K461DRAFT_277595 [Myriangium duriaei CBS 260.36]|uniref:Secreted protein n=1 Tax=Myriangium duriaei CBS 260.36 TaxID=1168546 RepID=A0A9P4J6S0_9PEZI|nr:hypothetical protein K461DRAFT_277595 [Myriangium duriaei CBS 260.36]